MMGLRSFKTQALWVLLPVLAVGAWWLQKPATPAAAPAAASAAPKSDSKKADKPSNVEVALVQQVRWVEQAQAVGTLVSAQSVTLRPEVAGRVVHVAFADGARVRTGQLLVQLDDALPQAELAQAQAQLAVAQANHQRNIELVAQNFVARRVLDESQANLKVAQAQVQLAQARWLRTRIVAPFAGVVGMRHVHAGDYVKEGADLVQLEDPSNLLVDFRLPEREQTHIRPGQMAQVTVDALPGQTFTARIKALDPLVDANGRSLLARAELLPPTKAALRPGMFVRVQVQLGVNEHALTVPEEAVVPNAQGFVMFRLQPAAAGSPSGTAQAQRVPVQLGARQNGQVHVVQGLHAGDTVVVAGQQRLKAEVSPVRVVELDAP